MVGTDRVCGTAAGSVGTPGSASEPPVSEAALNEGREDEVPGGDAGIRFGGRLSDAGTSPSGPLRGGAARGASAPRSGRGLPAAGSAAAGSASVGAAW